MCVSSEGLALSYKSSEFGGDGIPAIRFIKDPPRTGTEQDTRSQMHRLESKGLQVCMCNPCLNVASQWPFCLPGLPLKLGYTHNVGAASTPQPGCEIYPGRGTISQEGAMHFTRVKVRKTYPHSAWRRWALVTKDERGLGASTATMAPWWLRSGLEV